jgi:lysozyme
LPFRRLVAPLQAAPLHSVVVLMALPLLGPATSLGGSFSQRVEAGAAAAVLRRPAAAASSTAASSMAAPSRVAALSSTAGAYRITPERRALLNTIRYAEGTWKAGSPDGYRVIYGGGMVERLDRHPEIVVRRRYTSAAAGAYQFLPATWKEAAGKLALDDFGPASQDQAALYLIEKRGALQRFNREGLSHAVLAKLSGEWASLPAAHGGSAYGQPVKPAAELQAFYAAELARQRRSPA